jgi:molybdopterin/thiamine biosynthesis adenylyltransferase
MPLSDDQLERYSRQILLREIGGRGQERLLAARVLVVGAGGLGSPALLYLAAAGVGRLVVADGDVVDRSNLGRQVIHDEGTLGWPKTDSAEARIHALNPDVHVATMGRLAGAALAAAVAGADVVVEGSDSIPTKFAVNDAALAAGVPAVIGGVAQWEGQLMVVRRGAACWRCLFEGEPAADEAPPGCAVAGVLGALPGVIGAMQAAETVKLLLGGGGADPTGRLVTYDAWTGRTREVAVAPRAGCVACAGAARG